MLRYFILFQISLSTIAQFSKAKKTTSLNCSDMYLFAVLFKLQIACPFHEKRYAFLKNKSTFCSKRYFVCFGMYFFLDFYMFRKETSPEKWFDIKAITFSSAFNEYSTDCALRIWSNEWYGYLSNVSLTLFHITISITIRQVSNYWHLYELLKYSYLKSHWPCIVEKGKEKKEGYSRE